MAGPFVSTETMLYGKDDMNVSGAMPTPPSKAYLPLAIVLASAIVGGSLYAIQVNKQQSIERQQLLQLEETRKVEEAKMEQAKKDYTAKRKSDCLAIYKTEGDKWNNVSGWRYDEEDDKCFIQYKDSDPKSDAECDEKYPLDTDIGRRLFFMDNILCKDGKFENSF